MSPLSDWITAIATAVLAVMAVITIIRTYDIPFPWIKAKPHDPAPQDVMEPARLKEILQSQADRIQALEEQQKGIFDVLGEMAEVLRMLTD